MSALNSKNNPIPIPNTVNEGPSRLEISPTTPQKVTISPSKGGLFESGRKLLRRIGLVDEELPPSDAEIQQDEQFGQQYGGLDEDEMIGNGDGEVPQDGEDDGHILKREAASPISNIEIQIPTARRRKRKQPEPDVAEIPEEIPRAKRLRSRPLVVAKQPIASGRQLRGQAATAQLEEQPASDEPPFQSVNISRKAKTPSKPIEGNATAVPSKRGRPKRSTKGKEKQRDDGEASHAVPEQTNAQPESESGDAELYESHSPVKNQPLRTKGKLTRPKSKGRPSRRIQPHDIDEDVSMAAEDGMSKPQEEDVEEVGGMDVDEVDRLDGRKDAKGESEGQREPAENGSTLESDPLVEIVHFENMVTMANRVGHNYTDGEEQLLLQDKDKRLRTTSGNNVKKALEKLDSAYSQLQVASESGNDEETIAAERLADDCITSLQDNVQSLIDTEFKSKKSAHVKGYDILKRIKRVLMEIYFVIIPEYAKLILVAVRSNPLQETTGTSRLEQLLNMIKTFSKLVHGACDFPPSHQPHTRDLRGKYGSKTFAIQQPAIHLKPMIRHTLKLLKLELDSRKRVFDLAETEEWRLAKEQRQLERERAQAEEHQLKIDEARKRTAEAFKRHPLRDDPVFGPLIRKSEQQDKQERRASSQPHHPHRQPSGTLLQRQSGDHDQEQEADASALLDEDPEDIFGTEDRVRGVFPSNNKHDGSRPWTRAEKDTFMNIMRENSGEDRYSRVAEALQRSMDDIFAFAREVQGAFDEAHENGELNDRGDTWTYDVWSEPEVPRRS